MFLSKGGERVNSTDEEREIGVCVRETQRERETERKKRERGRERGKRERKEREREGEIKRCDEWERLYCSSVQCSIAY